MSKSWENEYDFLQIDRFEIIGEGRYTTRNCEENTYDECTPETKLFEKHFVLTITFKFF